MALTTRKRRRRPAVRKAARRVGRRTRAFVRRGRKTKRKVPLAALGGLVFGTQPVWEPLLRGDIALAGRNAADYFGQNGIAVAVNRWFPILFGVIVSVVFSKIGANKRLALPFFNI